MFADFEVDALCILCRGLSKPRDVAWALVVLMNMEAGRAHPAHEDRYRKILYMLEWVISLNLPVRDRRARFRGIRTSAETRDSYDHFVLTASVREAARRDGLQWPDKSIRRFVKAIKAGHV